MAAKDNKTVHTPAVKALSLFVEAKLTSDQYEVLSDTASSSYPSYQVLQEEAMQQCYQVRETYHVTLTSCAVELQALMNHTVSRLLTHLADKFDLNKKERRSLELICKWGCDATHDDHTERDIMITSLVPVRLVYSNDKKVIWENPSPFSIRYCRPIKIKLVEETKNAINQEISCTESEIQSLENCKFTKDGVSANIKVTMMLVMIDNQVCNAITDTLPTRCYICGVTPEQFNDLNVKVNTNIGDLSIGLSSLHISYRLFQSLLHLAYHLPLKTWPISAADEEIVAKRKAEIKDALKTKMHVIADEPTDEFSNGDAIIPSCRFFSDPEAVNEVTGIDSKLIYRLSIILDVLSSGHSVDVDKFSAYCLETAQLYVSLFAWMPMTLSLHLVLMHGGIVVEKILSPIGRISEDSVEMFESTEATLMEDRNLEVFKELLVLSDPVITGLRPKQQQASRSYPKEAFEMLRNVRALPDSDDSCEDENDVEDSDSE